MPIERIGMDKVDYYGTAEELTSEDDLVEIDIRVIGWKKKFRIRALSFAQMARINKQAADKEGNLQQEEFGYWTIVEGVVRPKMKIDQARKLAESNGAFVQELIDEIWDLGKVSREAWDAYIEANKRLNKVEEGDMTDEKPAVQ